MWNISGEAPIPSLLPTIRRPNGQAFVAISRIWRSRFVALFLIPARFVAGYAFALEPPDFHAYFEAYLDGGWYIFDPTRLAPQTGLIRVGTGHDAADTSFATIFGPATFSSMKVTMELLEGPAPSYTTDPISTSSPAS